MLVQVSCRFNKKGVKRKMLTSHWFASLIQVKLEGDVNILRLTPHFFAGPSFSALIF